jgi:hypothetical protein
MALDLDTFVLGKSLVVLGLAFFASGLVFLLPKRSQVPPPEKSVAEKIERTEYYLDQTRQEPNTHLSKARDDLG